MRADLHIHTYFSDGLQSPEDVALCAKSNGVGLISVTDHDTVLAYPELFTHCEKTGIKAVCGIEVSAYTDGVRLHTLGYGMDVNSALFKEFLSTLVTGSLERTDDILSKLKKSGVSLSLDEVLGQRKSPYAPVHSMHISRTAVKKGYAPDAFTFQRNFLSYGCDAYSGIGRPSPETAVEVITACGGFASLAHPGRIELEKQELIALVKRLVSKGLKGIEAEYSAHTSLQTAYYTQLAKEYNLSVTGGSDTHFHGGNKKIGTPVFDCGEELCEKLGLYS